MESLHLSFQRVVDAGMFKGIKLSSSLNLSHIFYVDNAVFMGQWYEGNINTLVHMLECFYRASSLRINMSKSKMMGVLVENDKARVIKAIHGDEGKVGKHVKGGDGVKITFWEDTWIGVGLDSSFRDWRILGLASLFCRKSRGGVEQEQYEALLGQVHDVTLVPIFDRWIWSLESSREFSVALIRKVIDDKRFSEVATKTR
ncbi:hypothetical protein Tco_1148246 [Tanacetum coccineum]